MVTLVGNLEGICYDRFALENLLASDTNTKEKGHYKVYNMLKINNGKEILVQAELDAILDLHKNTLAEMKCKVKKLSAYLNGYTITTPMAFNIDVHDKIMRIGRKDKFFEGVITDGAFKLENFNAER